MVILTSWVGHEHRVAHPDNKSEISSGEMPGLNGLILCGGKSRRMQTDKSLLEYHGLPQWQYVMKLRAMRITDIFM